MRKRDEIRRKMLPPKNGMARRKPVFHRKHNRLKTVRYDGNISGWNWTPSGSSILMRNKNILKAIGRALKGAKKHDAVALVKEFQNTGATFSILAQKTNADTKKPRFRIIDVRVTLNPSGKAGLGEVGGLAASIFRIKIDSSGFLLRDDQLYGELEEMFRFDRKLGTLKWIQKDSPLGVSALLTFQRLRDRSGTRYKLVTGHFTASPMMMVAEQ